MTKTEARAAAGDAAGAAQNAELERLLNELLEVA